MSVYTIQPVVKQVWQQAVSCKRGFRKKASLVNFYSNQDPFYCIVQSPLNHWYRKRTKLLPTPRRICNRRCLSVGNFVQKRPNGFACNFQGRLAMGRWTPQPFYGPFSGTTQVSRCQKRTSGLYGAREDLLRQTQTIRLGATPSGLTSAHLHHLPHIFYRLDALPAAQRTIGRWTND